MNARTHNTLIVYYSRTGRCSKLAAALRDELGGADIERIEDEIDLTGTRGLITASIRSLCRKKSAIKQARFAPEWYDEIYLITPIWSGTMTPALRTYLSAHKIDRCKLIACSGWTSEAGCKDELHKRFGITVLDHVRFVVDEIDEERYRDKLHRFIEPATCTPPTCNAPSPTDATHIDKEVCMPKSTERSCGKKPCKPCSTKTKNKSDEQACGSAKTKACSTRANGSEIAVTNAKNKQATTRKAKSSVASTAKRSRTSASNTQSAEL